MSGTRRSGSRRPARPAVVGDNDNGYVETDPTGRYGRFEEVLGKGAMKSVYRGFDEERGVEVAWNQASLCDVLRTPDALQRMYSEVQLLRTLRHDAIIGFHASWVDVPRRSFNFITELFSSGTLRSYRVRYPRVSLRAVRSWARQILRGLAYLHGHDPPVIHRDLKCDNIFVNGNQGQVKIGDLGLAAVLQHCTNRKAHSVIGTPEFMAPEMYDEEYDELVDVYSFGMCVLEMVTVEFPYAECSNPAQIYKKVTAGKLPDAFYRVRDEDARRFIGRCLVRASKRPSAAELLQDPFLLILTDDSSPRPPPLPLPAAGHQSPLFTSRNNSIVSSSDDTCSSSSVSSSDNDHHQEEQEQQLAEAEQRRDNNMTITGKLNAEEDTIFLKVQITEDDTGHVRKNIYFPFDMASDTATEVASEMVKELDITDRDASEIAAMIEQEIHRLQPPGDRGEQQHEYYSYEDNEEQPPFYYLSSASPATSSSSGGGFFSAGPHPHGGGWSKDHYCSYTFSDDDDDTTSSVHSSGKYSAPHYASSVHEKEEEDDGAQQQVVPEEQGRPGSSSSKATTTRFGPPGESSSKSRSPLRRGAEPQLATKEEEKEKKEEKEDDRRGNGRRLSRNRSMVDMRSQLLHRTLVEELNRRLFFNTVGAVEDIGFRAPSGYVSSSSSTRGRGRVEHRSRRSKEDDKDRYYMF